MKTTTTARTLRSTILGFGLALAGLAGCAVSASEDELAHALDDVEATEQGILGPNTIRIDTKNWSGHHDSDAANNGSPQCNQGTDVDHYHNTDPGTDGCHIGWTEPGEWLSYNFQVPTSGNYDIAARLGSALSGKKVRVSLYVSGQQNPAAVRTFSAPNQGWAVFEDATLWNQPLAGGVTHLLLVEHLTGGLDFNGFNINPASTRTRIEAESFFVAPDNTPTVNSGNNVACPSSIGVDLEPTSDPEGGNCNVGWGEAGEFLAWYVTAPVTGNYKVIARVASAVTGQFHVQDGFGNSSGTRTVSSGGWQEFQDITLWESKSFSGPGPNKPGTLALYITQSGVNVNYIELIRLP